MVNSTRYLKWSVNGGAYKIVWSGIGTGHFYTAIYTVTYLYYPIAPIPTGYRRNWSVKYKSGSNPPTAEPQISITTQNISYTIYFKGDWLNGPDEYWLFDFHDTIQQYKLTYTPNGGTLSGGTLAGDYNYDSTIDLPTTQNKLGHTFRHFTKDEVIISGTSFSLPASNTRVIAHWTIRRFSLTYTP